MSHLIAWVAAKTAFNALGPANLALFFAVVAALAVTLYHYDRLRDPPLRLWVAYATLAAVVFVTGSSRGGMPALSAGSGSGSERELSMSQISSKESLSGAPVLSAGALSPSEPLSV